MRDQLIITRLFGFGAELILQQGDAAQEEAFDSNQPFKVTLRENNGRTFSPAQNIDVNLAVDLSQCASTMCSHIKAVKDYILSRVQNTESWPNAQERYKKLEIANDLLKLLAGVTDTQQPDVKDLYGRAYALENEGGLAEGALGRLLCNIRCQYDGAFKASHDEIARATYHITNTLAMKR